MKLPERIGTYRIERLLGTGSFATVWLGHDENLGARVAIKVLADNWSYDLRVRERFLDEARMLWRLDHERVIRVHALGELDDGRPYLVMAWADGGSLRDRLATPLPIAHAVGLLAEIAAGVAVLHRHQIVHRDLTPGNVLFRGHQVVIADLGLAKALAAASGLTARAGTPGYMAPEQDDPLAVVDTRADVYGLGRLGLALLGGRAPAAVATVLRTAVATRPSARYRDATAFGVALRQAAAIEIRARHRVRRALSAAVAAAALVATMAASALVSAPDPAVGYDRTGSIAVRLPSDWQVDGGGWTSEQRAPGLVMSPSPDRWRTDDEMPGAFVGLDRRADTLETGAYLDEKDHNGCAADARRWVTLGGLEWTIQRYGPCPDGRQDIVEAVAVAPAGLLYAQITPAADQDVDELLSGIKVRI